MILRFFLVILIARLKSVEDTWDMIFSSYCGDDFLGRFLNTPFEEVQIGELLYLREMKCGTLLNLYK